jgi:polyhydroxyalkanoate synthase
VETAGESYKDELYAAFAKASQHIGKETLSTLKDSVYENNEVFTLFSTMTHKIFTEPNLAMQVQSRCMEFFEKQMKLWEAIMDKRAGKEVVPVITPAKQDKRFKSHEWHEAYYFDYLKQNYLLVFELLTSIVNVTDLDEKMKRKLNFYTHQFMDAFSPSNFLATNPEAIKLAKATNGQSLIDGYKNLLDDIGKGDISQTDTTAFEIGKNLAATPGEVVYENELIQLIQYKPTTKKVHEIPLLIIPPWINKYYILDLQPENSYVKFIVDHGFTLFIISWKNPDASMSHIGFEEYVELGAFKAMEVVQNISGAKKINTLGYCLGGTLLSIALSMCYSKKKVPVQSVTFLAAMIDFTDIGPMGDIVDEALVNKMENEEMKEHGMMRGRVMGRAFNAIRSNDLMWGYVVNNYLMGKKPPPFDILFWNGDNTNLPARMYIYYLRYMLFENKLSRKNALRINNVPIDIGRIDLPAFVIGTNEDHISPAPTTFTTTELLSGPVEYVLGGSGHVMGIVNPPVKNKYYYLTEGKLGAGFDEWKKSAKQFEGSWWTPWIKWLARHSGEQKAAPKKQGNAKYKPIEPAPGRYVKESCETKSENGSTSSASE